MRDTIVRLIDMPLCVKGFTVLDQNGDYNIYLNAGLTEETRRETYMHELDHIAHDDFDETVDILAREAEMSEGGN